MTFTFNVGCAVQCAPGMEVMTSTRSTSSTTYSTSTSSTCSAIVLVQVVLLFLSFGAAWYDNMAWNYNICIAIALLLYLCYSIFITVFVSLYLCQCI